MLFAIVISIISIIRKKCTNSCIARQISGLRGGIPRIRMVL